MRCGGGAAPSRLATATPGVRMMHEVLPLPCRPRSAHLDGEAHDDAFKEQGGEAHRVQYLLARALHVIGWFHRSAAAAC